MRTLHVFGPGFGLPDASPFGTKAHVLLKLAGLDYATRTADLRKAPKGKAPWLVEDDGEVVADTGLMRAHIAARYGHDYDFGLSAREAAIACAFERMCDEYLYWVILAERWYVPENFEHGPARFFDAVPQPMRPIIKAMVRRQVRRDGHGQGIARHDRSELATLAAGPIAALDTILQGQDFMGGDGPCGADAGVFGCVAALTAEGTQSAILDDARARPALKAYAARMMQRFFPTD